MKYELWYKDSYSNQARILLSGKFHGPTTEPPGTQSKNGYHLVVKQTDLPTPSAREATDSYQGLPRTLLEVRNSPSPLGKSPGPLGRAVCQLLASGCVNYGKFQTLYQHLTSLGQEYEKLRQALLDIPDDKLRQVDEEAGGKK